MQNGQQNRWQIEPFKLVGESFANSLVVNAHLGLSVFGESGPLTANYSLQRYTPITVGGTGGSTGNITDLGEPGEFSSSFQIPYETYSRVAVSDLPKLVLDMTLQKIGATLAPVNAPILSTPADVD